jgi:hypothetical protein
MDFGTGPKTVRNAILLRVKAAIIRSVRGVRGDTSPRRKSLFLLAEGGCGGDTSPPMQRVRLGHGPADSRQGQVAETPRSATALKALNSIGMLCPPSQILAHN